MRDGRVRACEGVCVRWVGLRWAAALDYRGTGRHFRAREQTRTSHALTSVHAIHLPMVPFVSPMPGTSLSISMLD